MTPWVSFVRGNPINLRDPSGYDPYCGGAQFYECINYPENGLSSYGVNFTADNNVEWDQNDINDIIYSVKTIATEMYTISSNVLSLGTPSNLVFYNVFGEVNFHYSSGSVKGYFCERASASSGLRPGVICYANSRNQLSPYIVAHELGHVFNATVENKRSSGAIPVDTVSPYEAMNKGIYQYIYVDDTSCWEKGIMIAGSKNGAYVRTTLGIVERANTLKTNGEDFADTFANYMIHYRNLSAGDRDEYHFWRGVWMVGRMSYWLSRMLPGAKPKEWLEP